jgi:putative N6-adenine-specific DNA methylase
MEMVAKTLFGLEEVLGEELRSLGAGRIRLLNRAVAFSGDRELMYRANYFLRTALKVLIPIRETELQDSSDLYNSIRAVEWEKYMQVDDTLAVEVALKSDLFSHSQFVAQKIKDAIVDQFRDKYGRRPSVDLNYPVLRINAYLHEKTLALSLDSSGEPLYRRGYRIRQGPAPLNEVLAAGLIRLSGWNETDPFVDAMCGSGTIPIEAALMAHGRAPGSLGRTYGFQKWKDFDPLTYKRVVQEGKEKVRQGRASIFASDISSEAVRLAVSHAKNARVDSKIQFTTSQFKDFLPPSPPGVLVINPPYGERIIPENINRLYTDIGDTLKARFNGFTAWIFSGNPEALKQVGLRPSRKIQMFNGQLECRFQCYTMYAGSKKSKYSQSGTP